MRAMDRGPRGEPAGERCGDRRQVGVRDDLVHDPQLECALRLDRLPEHHQLRRTRWADQARKEVRARQVGDEPDAHEGLNEGRRLCGDAEVAREREREAGPGGHPVDRCDDRLIHRSDRPDGRGVVIAEDRADVDRPLADCGAKILTAAEAPAGARDDHRADGPIRCGLVAARA